MDERKRIIVLSFSEIIDRLSILNIKRFFNKKDSIALSKEIQKLSNDIDLFLDKHKILCNAQHFRLIISLAQINLSIWLIKEEMTNNKNNYLKNMKLGHQLNGIRNQIKNKILKINGLSEVSYEKTNIARDNLSGWFISALNGNNDSINNNNGENEYKYLLSELFDRMTICQIKEMLFEKKQREAITIDLNNISHDIDLIINSRKINNSGKIINLVIILGLCNLIAWRVKDKMELGLDDYDINLHYSTQIISLRNFVLNLLIKEFQEETSINSKAIFFEDPLDISIASIIRDLEQNK